MCCDQRKSALRCQKSEEKLMTVSRSAGNPNGFYSSQQNTNIFFLVVRMGNESKTSPEWIGSMLCEIYLQKHAFGIPLNPVPGYHFLPYCSSPAT